MVTIQIVNQSILLDLLFLDEFQSVKKYVTTLPPTFEIRSHVDHYPILTKQPTVKTRFYDLYEENNQTIQVQRMDGKEVGCIIYQGNVIHLYLKIVSFAIEYLLSQYAFVFILNQLDQTLFMHASTLVYHKKGIILTARSGTGKSTHARLWRQYTDAVTLNDDKNVLVYEDNELILYPNPWSGKHHLDNNMKAPAACIVFLYQSPNNTVRRLNKIEGLKLLLPQIEQPKKENINSWNILVDHLLDLPMYYYGCNMEQEAVEVLKKRLEMDLCL